MRKFRKVAAGLLAAAILLTAGGCGGKTDVKAGAETTVGTDAKDEKSREDLKVGICIYRFEDDFMDLYREELGNYLESTYGIPEENIIVMDGMNDQEEQMKQIDSLVKQNVDVMILNMVQASSAKTAADKCSAAGIPAVFINREPEEAEIARWTDESIAAVYVGADARQSGTYQGEIILETPVKGDFNGDGKVSYVMIMGDAENVDALYRSEYSIKALEAGGMRTEKLLEKRGDWKEEKGRELAENALIQYGSRVEVIFCNNDAMANGARDAILKAGRTVGKDIYLVGVDALEETVKYVKEGTVTGTVLNDHAGQAHAAADAAVKMVLGEKVDTRYTVDYIKIAAVSPPVKLPEPETEAEETGEETADLSESTETAEIQ